MGIMIDTEKQPDWSFDLEAVTKEVVLGAADYEGCPYEIEVQVLLTDDEGIHEVNREHRGIDTPTDVLSFPMIDFREPGVFDELEEDTNIFAFHPESGELILGDIVISVTRAVSQAQEYGHGIKREYAFLLVHSMLHLFGYDHIEEQDRLLMESRQKEILEHLNIPR